MWLSHDATTWKNTPCLTCFFSSPHRAPHSSSSSTPVWETGSWWLSLQAAILNLLPEAEYGNKIKGCVGGHCQLELQTPSEQLCENFVMISTTKLTGWAIIGNLVKIVLNSPCQWPLLHLVQRRFNIDLESSLKWIRIEEISEILDKSTSWFCVTLVATSGGRSDFANMAAPILWTFPRWLQPKYCSKIKLNFHNAHFAN